MSALSAPQRPAAFRPITDLNRRPVDWLWPGRLPLGKLSLLEGDPGLGKSYLALDLCARLSSGRPWPDGSASPGPSAAVYLNAEDGPEDTLAPRLLTLGADPAAVYLLDRSGDELSEVMTLGAQLRTLDELLARVRPRLLVVDPVLPFLGPGVNVAGDVSVRRALSPLADLAARHACAVLLIRHLNKSDRGPALYRGLGSIGLVGACRSAWLVAERPEAPGQRVLAQVKNNLAARQPSLSFALESAEDGATTLHWLGEVEEGADELLSRRRKAGRPSAARVCARSVLESLLADGPLTAHEIWDKVKSQGFSVRTLRRARDELGIRSARVFTSAGLQTYWLMKHQDLPADLHARNLVDDPGRLLQEYDPFRCPLD
jgi:putative DNA primase/helicase